MLDGISKVAVAVLLNPSGLGLIVGAGVGLIVRVALGMGGAVGSIFELNIDWLSCHKTAAKMITNPKATAT